MCPCVSRGPFTPLLLCDTDLLGARFDDGRVVTVVVWGSRVGLSSRGGGEREEGTEDDVAHFLQDDFSMRQKSEEGREDPGPSEGPVDRVGESNTPSQTPSLS